MDGQDVWQVHQRDVIFVVIGKTTMAVTQGAQAVAKGERVQVRERVVWHGPGKTAREERLRTEWGGIADLTTFDSSDEPEQTQGAQRRDSEAVHQCGIVRCWVLASVLDPSIKTPAYIPHGFEHRLILGMYFLIFII
ncbi:MAG TPA: hypothetical protein VGF67_33030 [Ktedonobacteraceae bacterium]|jgi:hypothetical protein